MIKLTSTRFGELEIDDGDVIQFPLGIPGFEDKRRWILIGDEDNAIMWMHSTEDEALALPVVAPDSVKSDYNAQIPRESLEPIGDVREGDVTILIVVTIPPDRPWDMTANLKAPIVVNRAERVAMQTIALNNDYDFRYQVLDENTRKSMREQATSKGAGG
ncbi:MAG: flagellar assembly protein FliW [Synergistaceae bacterium]|jgi:flagellar assembly factor FliW|nr:flagellar assembly protein FliW [Synergistaceae bacterium]